MELHIGSEIEKKFLESGMRPGEFAKRINTGARNIYTIFKRKGINSDLLKKIGEVLNFDFFTLYQEPKNEVNEPLEKYNEIPTNDILKLITEIQIIQRYLPKNALFTAADLYQISLLQEIRDGLGKQVSPILN